MAKKSKHLKKVCIKMFKMSLSPPPHVQNAEQKITLSSLSPSLS